MAYLDLTTMPLKRIHLVAGLSMALLATAAGLAPVQAQQAAPAQPAAADQAPPDPTAPAAADAGKTDPSKQVFWVKICGKTQVPDPAAKDPKTAKPIDKGFCITQQERLDGNTAAVLVSAAIREDDGVNKKGLLVTVPASVIIPAGVRIAFDDEKDEKKFVALPYQICLPAGCTAEIEATPELIDQMNKAKVMTVYAINIQGFAVPLKLQMGGFTTAMSGKPIDAAKYFNARKNMIMDIQERLYAKQRAAQAALNSIKQDQAADPAKAGAAPAADPNAKTTTGN